MDPHYEIYFLILIAVVAFLYASVGHGGASGYLAMMSLFGFSQTFMKPSALVLNLIVSAISFTMYYRSGHFKWKLLLPFIILSIPLSFIGAKISIDKQTYKLILGVCLIIATSRLLGLFGKPRTIIKVINIPFALIIGGVLGFVSGMIGIGGGILLSPIILLLGWADLKQTAAISAAFIFLNSASGLTGMAFPNFANFGLHPVPIAISPDIWIWVATAVTGGLFGAFYGSGRFNLKLLRYILSGVLLFASYSLILGK